MEISAEHAVSLLRKWHSERIPVSVLIALDGSAVVVKVRGFVNGISDDILISGNPDIAKEAANPEYSYVLFSSSSTRSYHYEELKDMPFPEDQKKEMLKSHGLANLCIKLKDGTLITIFEHDTA